MVKNPGLLIILMTNMLKKLNLIILEVGLPLNCFKYSKNSTS